MSKEARLPSLTPITDPDELLIGLKKHVLYVLLMDTTTGDPNKIRAKVLDINATKTYKPRNDTTSVLLYFLSREDDDLVLLSDYLSLFAGFEKEAEIIDFLVDLDAIKKILKVMKVPKGTQGANKDFLDPVNLLGTLTDWQTPFLDQDAQDPICKTTTYYTLGSIAFNVKR